MNNHMWTFKLRQFIYQATKWPLENNTAYQMGEIIEKGREYYENFKSELYNTMLPMSKTDKYNYYLQLVEEFYPSIDRYIKFYEDSVESINTITQKPNPYYHLNEFCKDTKKAIELLRKTYSDSDAHGYRSSLSDQQVELLYKSIKGNYIAISTELENFKLIFTDKHVSDIFEPIKWIKYPTKNKIYPAKRTLMEMLSLSGINVDRTDIKNLDKLFAKRDGTSLKFTSSNFNDSDKDKPGEFYSELEMIFSNL